MVVDGEDHSREKTSKKRAFGKTAMEEKKKAERGITDINGLGISVA